MKLINPNQDNKTLLQLFCYGIIGIVNNTIGYFIFLLMSYFGITPKLAITLIYPFCATVNYLSNWRITFSGSGRFTITSVRFLMTHLTGYFINLILLLVFVDYLGYSYHGIEAIAIIIVAVYIFIAFKLFVFPIDG